MSKLIDMLKGMEPAGYACRCGENSAWDTCDQELFEHHPDHHDSWEWTKVYTLGQIEAAADEAEMSDGRVDGELLAALKLVMPLAKGYAAAHPVGSNAAYVHAAEEAIQRAESPEAEPVALDAEQKAEAVPVAEFIEDATAVGGARFRLLGPLKVGTRLFTEQPDQSARIAELQKQINELAGSAARRERAQVDVIADLRAQLTATQDKLAAAEKDAPDVKLIVDVVMANFDGRRGLLDGIDSDALQEICESMHVDITEAIASSKEQS